MSDALWQALSILNVIGLIVVSLVLVGSLRQLGTVMVRLTPARPGEIEGGPARGEHVALDGLRAGRPAIVLFMAPGCDLCDDLVPVLPTVSRHYRELDLFVALPEHSDTNAYSDRLTELARPDLHELFSAWEIPGTPFAVGLDASHLVVSSGVTNNVEHIEALAERLLRMDEVGDAAGIDSPAAVALPTLVATNTQAQEVPN